MQIRDLDEARTILSQGICLQAYIPATPNTVEQTLKWCLEIMNGNHPLPSAGFVADVGHILQGAEPKKTDILPAYEDQVLGKVYANFYFTECGEVLRGYKNYRNFSKGVAFIVNQIMRRTKTEGFHISPGILNTLLSENPEDILNYGKESLEHDGIHPELSGFYDSLIAKTRSTGDILVQEDMYEVQSGIFLDEEGERLAFRQVFSAASVLEKMLPRHFMKPTSVSRETPTSIFEENTYPVGGFTSITNRGSIENILHSQLAYIEDGEAVDMFDIKYLRDELLYYSRDENQFLRKRRNFLFFFSPTLMQTIRVKDAKLPYQRGVFLQAFIFVLIRKILEELSADALHFHFVFPMTADMEICKECEIFARIFREQMVNETVSFHIFHDKDGRDKITHYFSEKYPMISLQEDVDIPQFCKKISERSLSHCVYFSALPNTIEGKNFLFSNLILRSPSPETKDQKDADDEPVDFWGEILKYFIVKMIYCTAS